jgi:hypothetical protein
MGFKAFTSAVLLAQGRFAEFLSSAPKARDDILRELFGVASMDGAREAAQAAEAAALAEAQLREGDRARLPVHDGGGGPRRAGRRPPRATPTRWLRPMATAPRGTWRSRGVAGARSGRSGGRRGLGRGEATELGTGS